MTTLVAAPVTIQTVEMTLEKETKGAVRYAAATEEGQTVLPTLYVRKDAFEGQNVFPQVITVTISV